MARAPLICCAARTSPCTSEECRRDFIVYQRSDDTYTLERLALYTHRAGDP
jgi:hypothetical protein